MTYRTPSEKTGKRNLHYLLRHRIYGSYLKMYDLDCVEYHHLTKQPVCIIETKFGLQGDLDFNDDQFECHFNLAEKLEIPFVCLIYYPFGPDGKLLDANEDHSKLSHIQFRVMGVNSKGINWFPRPRSLTEVDWVKELYKLRGLSLNDSLTGSLYQTWKQDVRIPFVCPRPPG